MKGLTRIEVSKEVNVIRHHDPCFKIKALFMEVKKGVLDYFGAFIFAKDARASTLVKKLFNPSDSFEFDLSLRTP